MANRYVWEKYNNTSYTNQNVTNSVGYEKLVLDTGANVSYTISNYPTIYYKIYKSYKLDSSSMSFLLSDPVNGGSGSFKGSLQIDVGLDYCIVFSTSQITSSTYTAKNFYRSRITWSYLTLYYTDKYYWIDCRGDGTTGFCDRYGVTTSNVKGSLIGYVSGKTSSTYPSNAVSGSYWYVYKGSDCIDPTAVGYSTTTPKGGSSITVNVTARSNTYGGTISYQYQYSTNGGSTYTNSGSETTATSKSITIPSGVTQFCARVVASDNYGFTSTTYVTGANLTVINGEIKVGMAGVVKTGTPVVGRAGTVKTSVKVYQCVGGVIKQS